MSLASEGSVAEKPAGAPETQQSATENGSAAAAGSSPFAGLRDEAARQWVEKKGYKSVDDVVSGAWSLEKSREDFIKRPADGAPKEEWDKIHSKLGWPGKPDAYEFKRPEGLPPDLPYDETLAGGFKGWANEARLSSAQAQTLHDQFVAYNAEQAKAHMTALTKAVETTAADLVKEWGPQDSEGFKAKIEMTNKALKKLGLVESFQKSGIILKDGALTDASLAKAFSVIGERMFAEDKIDGVGSGESGDNPFKEPKNITAISRLAKNDPDKARRLAREAGVDPEQWLGGRRR